MNQSEEAIPTTGVSTVKSRTRKSTAESKDTTETVSTASAKKRASTTKGKTTNVEPVVTPKKRGRPKKNIAVVEEKVSTAKVSSVVPGDEKEVSEPPKKKRGRPRKEVLARALAIIEVAKKKKRLTKEEKKVAHMTPLENFEFPEEPAWPFPTSTRYNNDGTEKEKSSGNKGII